MISALTGELRGVDGSAVHVRVGPILYELLVPAADLPDLEARVGDELTLHTRMYLEGDAARGNLEPRLLGFLRPDDKRFFDLFVTVKGIGARMAMRALTAPVGEIARAIEAKETRTLVGLPGVGKRTAEQIVAELSGRVGRFATSNGRAAIPAPSRRSSLEEEALAALVQLGERRAEAERLLERARQGRATWESPDALLREMLRLRSVG